VVNFAQYKYFTAPPPENNFAGSGKTTRLYSCVTPETVDRALVVKGLSYKIDYNGIKKIFSEVDLAKDAVFIEENNGHKSGTCMVIFSDKTLCQKAKGLYQGKTVEGRGIELFDSSDTFMRKVCHL
tara:strand:- start:63 stop:440 length:378 start_codon:yes stop_codon:yes gene_type:complete